jgi:hypothetical protein
MAAFNTVHRSHTCFKFPGATKPEGFMELVKNELSPQSMPCLSYDALCEAIVLYRAMVLWAVPGFHFSEKQDERFLKSVLVWTSSTTCSIRKFDGPRNNFKRKILGSSVRKRFRVRSLSRCPLMKAQPHLRRRSSGGRRIIDYCFGYPHRRHQSDSQRWRRTGGYTTNIIVPLAIVGTVIASMLPR